MTHVSLFAGIGGMDIAAERAGFRTILQVERADYPHAVLCRRWPETPKLRDVREVTRESVTEPVTVVSGGFPCQPFSSAGKRRGRRDRRYLWPDMFRAILALDPRWAVAENVPGLISHDDGRTLGGICHDLESAGYEVLPLVYPAHAVGAPHARQRLFIVAYADRPAVADPEGIGGRLHTRRRQEGRRTPNVERGGQVMAHSPRGDTRARQTPRGQQVADRRRGTQPVTRQRGEWNTEPDVGRVAHGVPHRLDRLKCLGNAVVPAQAYPIFAGIAAVEATA